MDDWLGKIYDLAEKISLYRKRQERLPLDKNRAWQRIKELEKEYALEINPAVKQQYYPLESVENTRQRAEFGYLVRLFTCRVPALSSSCSQVVDTRGTKSLRVANKGYNPHIQAIIRRIRVNPYNGYKFFPPIDKKTRLTALPTAAKARNGRFPPYVAANKHLSPAFFCVSLLPAYHSGDIPFPTAASRSLPQRSPASLS